VDLLITILFLETPARSTFDLGSLRRTSQPDPVQPDREFPSSWEREAVSMRAGPSTLFIIPLTTPMRTSALAAAKPRHSRTARFPPVVRETKRHMSPCGKTEFTALSAVAAQFTQKCERAEGLRGVIELGWTGAIKSRAAHKWYAGDDGAAEEGDSVDHPETRSYSDGRTIKIAAGTRRAKRD